MEDVNWIDCKNIWWRTSCNDQNSSSDEQADESPEPNFTNEEFEELFSKIMMPENDSTIHNIRKRTFWSDRASKSRKLFMDWIEGETKRHI